MKAKRIFCCFLAAAVITCSIGMGAVSAFASDPGKSVYSSAEAQAARFSDEYKGTEFYSKLMTALEENKDASVMERTLAAALSQEGYKNYATSGIDIEQAKAEGKIWTGAEKRMSEDETGNTEYTRWAQRYVSETNENAQYYDFDWCAIFVSWCLYNAGYYTDEQLKKYYYSYYADPRIESDADSWITAFNMEQENVWYTSKASRKLELYSWNHFVNTEIDPFDIPYKPGGLIFFTWNATGNYFSHIGIVVDYDEDTHVLTYTNGNSDGEVITRSIALDNEEEYRGNVLAKNSDRIMAYAEYDGISKLEKKIITADQTDYAWDLNSEKGITINTNSDSKICSVSKDGSSLGSNIESNMVLLYGNLSIGKSELVKLGTGTHHLLLTFDDGTLEIRLIIYDSETELTVETTEFTWDRNSDDGISVKTNSVADNLKISIGDEIIGTEETEGVELSDGVLTLGKEYLDSVLSDGENNVKLVFPEGEIEIKVNVINTKELTAEPTEFTWNRNSDDEITVKTNSDSETVALRMGGATIGTENTEGIELSDGVLTLSKEYLDSVLSDGENTVKLVFSDGEVWITIDAVNNTETYDEPDPEQSDPEQSDPEQSDPEQSEPEQSEPEQSEPEQSEPEQSEPEQSEPEKNDTEESGNNGNRQDDHRNNEHGTDSDKNSSDGTNNNSGNGNNSQSANYSDGKYADTPYTGDSAFAAALLAVMIIGAAGIVLAKKEES